MELGHLVDADCEVVLEIRVRGWICQCESLYCCWWAINQDQAPTLDCAFASSLLAMTTRSACVQPVQVQRSS